MRNRFTMPNVLVVSLCYLTFVRDCNALSERDITFFPQTITKNVSQNPIGDNLNLLKSLRGNAEGENIESSLRFWALVVSFNGKGLIKVQSTENAGTEPAAERDKLKVEAFREHAFAIIETNLDGLLSERKVHVDVVKVQFLSRKHPEFGIQKVKRKRRNASEFEILQFAKDLDGSKDDRILVPDNVWDGKDVELLCRLPFLVDLVSANWLFRKKQASRRSRLPRDNFKGKLTMRKKGLKCLRSCMNQLDEPKKVVEGVKKKVKEIRKKARISLRRMLRKNGWQSLGQKPSEVPNCNLIIREKESAKRKRMQFKGYDSQEEVHSDEDEASNGYDEVLRSEDEVSGSEDEDSGGDEDRIRCDEGFDVGRINMKRSKKSTPYKKFKGFQMDGCSEVREFGLILPSDSLDAEKSRYKSSCAPNVDAILRNSFFKRLRSIQVSHKYENCDHADPPWVTTMRRMDP